MEKHVPLYETKNYAVISVRHIVNMSVEGEDVQNRLLEIWCNFFEELREAGYRPLHRFHRPQSILCEKTDLEARIWKVTGQIESRIQELEDMIQEIENMSKPLPRSRKSA